MESSTPFKVPVWVLIGPSMNLEDLLSLRSSSGNGEGEYALAVFTKEELAATFAKSFAESYAGTPEAEKAKKHPQEIKTMGHLLRIFDHLQKAGFTNVVIDTDHSTGRCTSKTITGIRFDAEIQDA